MGDLFTERGMERNIEDDVQEEWNLEACRNATRTFPKRAVQHHIRTTRSGAQERTRHSPRAVAGGRVSCRHVIPPRGRYQTNHPSHWDLSGISSSFHH
jgi:IS5 family transposase